MLLQQKDIGSSDIYVFEPPHGLQPKCKPGIALRHSHQRHLFTTSTDYNPVDDGDIDPGGVLSYPGNHLYAKLGESDQ